MKLACIIKFRTLSQIPALLESSFWRVIILLESNNFSRAAPHVYHGLPENVLGALQNNLQFGDRLLSTIKADGYYLHSITTYNHPNSTIRNRWFSVNFVKHGDRITELREAWTYKLSNVKEIDNLIIGHLFHQRLANQGVALMDKNDRLLCAWQQPVVGDGK